MTIKLRNGLILALLVLAVIGAFMADVYIFSEAILPGPPYFVPILIAAYFLSARETAGIAVFATAAKLTADLVQHTPAWLLTSYFAAIVTVGFAGVALASKMRGEAAFAREMERLRTNAEQRAIELKTIVGSIADAVFVCDPQGNITLINQAGLALVGEEEGKAQHTLTDYQESLQLRHLDGRPLPLDDLVITRALHGEVSRGREEIGTHPITHRRVDLLISAAPLKDEAGRVIGAVEVAADITIVRELTEEAQRRAAELDVANKELETFSYSVSHDLRAPLRHIDGFCQVLLEDCTGRLDQQGQQYLQFIREASQKMKQLIDDLLQLSRVTRSEMRREDVDLSAMAHQIADELKSEQPERQVEFSIAPGIVVSGDQRLLRVALDNLLCNAWKFTSKCPWARIEFGGVHQDSTQVYYVRDNGAGFDMDYAAKLFTPFQRLHAVEEFPGTGIGLATVQRIIRRHGGHVWAEGAVDKGATFYFTLP